MDLATWRIWLFRLGGLACVALGIIVLIVGLSDRTWELAAAGFFTAGAVMALVAKLLMLAKYENIQRTLPRWVILASPLGGLGYIALAIIGLTAGLTGKILKLGAEEFFAGGTLLALVATLLMLAEYENIRQSPLSWRTWLFQLCGLGCVASGVIGLIVGYGDRTWILETVGFFTGGSLLALGAILLMLIEYEIVMPSLVPRVALVSTGVLTVSGVVAVVWVNFVGLPAEAFKVTPFSMDVQPGVSFSVTRYTVGSGPHSLAIADLNGDGKPDLATANPRTNNVSVLLGTGDGSFGLATNFPVGALPYGVAIGDLNGDGKPDLAVSSTGADSVSVLLGTGDGSFGAANDFSVGNYVTSVAIEDLNIDGLPDLVATNRFGKSVSVLLSIGDGSFAAATNLPVSGLPNFVAIGDLNGDTLPDLAVAYRDGTGFSVHHGIGNGFFGDATHFPVAGADQYSLAIDDLNDDGLPDIAVVSLDSNNVSIILGTETGPFGATAILRVGGQPLSVAIGDISGDGKLDLAVANDLAGSISVLLGAGDGSSFGPPTNFPVGSAPHYVAIGDLDGDGKLDLAVANEHSDYVSVLINTSP